MTAEKAQSEFNKLIAENGFTIAGHTGDSGIPIYHRVWKDGNKTLEVRIMQSGEYTLMTVKKNGKIAGDIVRDYSSPKKAFDAIQEIANTIYCAS